MSHTRKQIRDAVVAVVGGLSTTGANVFSGRTRPLAKDHVPTILVYAIEEESDAHTMGRPKTILRRLKLAIEGRVTGGNVPDDQLELIAAEVETAIGSDPTFGGLAKDTTLVATRINTQAPGENEAGEIRMEFEVIYITREDDPENLPTSPSGGPSLDFSDPDNSQYIPGL